MEFETPLHGSGPGPLPRFERLWLGVMCQEGLKIIPSLFV